MPILRFIKIKLYAIILNGGSGQVESLGTLDQKFMGSSYK